MKKFARIKDLVTVALGLIWLILFNACHSTSLEKNIQWSSFIANQDMVWDELPVRWETAPFLGNGLVGAMVYSSKDSSTINFDLGRSDIGKLDYPGQFRNNNRIQIGLLQLKTKGKFLLSQSIMRLSLWDAKLIAHVQTSEGAFTLEAFMCEDQAAVAVKIKDIQGAEKPTWNPYFYNKGYLTKEEQISYYEVKDQVFHQRSEAQSGGHVVAWSTQDSVTYISIHSSPSTHSIWNKTVEGKQDEMDLAKATQEYLQSKTWEQHFNTQAKWWHDYYPKSFVSFENKELENYYWLQLYKLGSTARSGYPMIDNHGVWSPEHVYGFATWDLNVQLIYQLHLKSNHHELGEPLVRFMDDNFNRETMWMDQYQEMRAGLRQQTFLRYRFFDTVFWEHDTLSPCDGPAKFLWGCHNYYLQYQYTQDSSLLPKLRDKLEAGVNAVLAGMTEEDGKLVVPYGHSWESWKGKNPNGILAVTRWALETLIELEETLGCPATKDWDAILKKITPYEIGKNGFLFGQGKEVFPHRHWSHLLQIYPLKNFDVKNDSNYQLALKSIDYWALQSCGLNGETSRAGYAPSGAMCLYAQLGHTDKMAELIDVFLHKKSSRGPNVWPATMYREYGPVIETPLFFAASLQELILQSKGNEIKIFPAWPKELGDVVFDNWRTEGGLFVSAEKKDGNIRFVKVKSAFDGVFLISGLSDMKLSEGKSNKVSKTSNDTYQLTMKANDSILFIGKDKENVVILPIETDSLNKNLFGWNERFLQNREYIKEYKYEGR